MKKTKKTLEAISAVFWFVLGILVCYRASSLGVGSASEPGSGFIFFWSGLIMAILALIIFADSRREVSEQGRALDEINWRKVSLVLAALVLYALFLEKLGFVVATFMLMSFLLGIGDHMKRLTVLAIAGAATLSMFALFDLWLQVRLPKGMFGF